MAGKVAAQRARKAGRGQSGQSSLPQAALRWGQIGAGLLFVALATPSAVLLCCLLLPSFLVWLAENQAGKPVTRAVLLYGLAAACGSLDTLWRAGHQMQDALTLAMDPHNLALAWAAQAAGWLLTQCLPMLIGVAMEARATLAIATLKRRRARLHEEWQPGA